MSMINPSDRYRRNPLESARQFIANEPLVNRTLSGTFQPAISETDAPMSAIEQAVSDVEGLSSRLSETEQQAEQELASSVRFAEVRERRRQREQQEFEQQLQDQYYAQGQQGEGFTSVGDQQTPANIGNLSGSRQDVVRKTASYAGTPYQLGGRTVQGIDCSGLVMAVYNQAGFNISQHSAGWQGRNIPGARTAVNNLQPGDIVAWKDGSHIAIYAGNGMIWDASRSRGTSMRKLWAPESAVYGIKLRFPGE